MMAVLSIGSRYEYGGKVVLSKENAD